MKILKTNYRSDTALQNNEIKKTFFEKEYYYPCKASNNLFACYDWYTPWIDFNEYEMWFTTEYYNPECRLDKVAPLINKEKREEIATDILEAILDMYIAGYSHRDIHAKNIFYVNGKIKIIDYEYIHRHYEIPFLESYDITGRNLDSPCNAQNMSFTKHEPSSIIDCLGVDFDKILDFLYKRILDKLYKVSGSFRTKNGNHVRSKGSVYASFDLPTFNISKDDAQRDTKKRFEQFGITNKEISGRTILDIGCGTGALGFSLEKYKPKKYYGLEYRSDQVDVAQKIAAFSGITNYKFIEMDIDKQKFDVEVDTVFCLSVNKHVKDQDGLYSYLGKYTGKTLFFEGNSGTDIEEVKVKLSNVGFTSIEFIDYCQDDIKDRNNNRPMFVARK